MSEKLAVVKGDAPWYRDGLAFKCTGCGKCCTGSPGYVWVTEDEIIAISEYLNITIQEFSNKHLRKIGNRFSLRESTQTYDCTFLHENKCSIYETRPKQCKTYPWWIQNLRSREDWEIARLTCEGINHPDAAIISQQEIEHLSTL